MTDIRAGLIIAGRYRLEAAVGEGGMATVWRGMDLSLSREVAVKILREEIAASPDAVARFRREAHSAAKLNHPNIVQIYDTGVDDGIHYIVMEYLPEPDLKRIVSDWAPLPEEKVVDVAIQCCRALAFAHRSGIVHRDVKPHNILFTNEGQAKLSDFGIAAAVGAHTDGAGGFVLGSAHSISPEQVQGRPAGPHSDVYSLGCVMYEALSGKTPFQGRTTAEIAAQHVHARPVPLRSLNPAVSPSVEHIVGKAMAREVARRYRSAEEMLVHLMKVSDGEELDRTGVLATPEGATSIIQPDPPPPSAPVVNAADGEMDVQPSAPPPQQPEAPAEIAPVLRPSPAPGGPSWLTTTVVVLVLAVIVVLAWLVKSTLFPGQAGRTVQVPMVKNLAPAAAGAMLEASDLKVGDTTYKEDSMQPQGVVIEQTPAEGQMVPASTVVDLVVNRGTTLVMVIPVEGMSLEEATRTLEEAGLRVGLVTDKCHAQVLEGHVIKQSIRPGVNANKGTPIDLEVSTGPEPEPPAAPIVDEPTDTAPVPPDVAVIPDETFTSADPAERKFIVTVTVQGQELGQLIQVVKQDDSVARLVVLDRRLDPNESQRIPVVVEGSAVIEVLHNGRSVYTYPAPFEPPAEGDAPPE